MTTVSAAKRIRVASIVLLWKLRSSLRQRNRLRKSDIPPPEQAQWLYLRNASDEGLIAVTSLTRSAFDHLLLRFKVFYLRRVRNVVTGRRRILPADGVLYLVLDYLCGPATTTQLCRMYCVPPSTLGR